MACRSSSPASVTDWAEAESAGKTSAPIFITSPCFLTTHERAIAPCKNGQFAASQGKLHAKVKATSGLAFGPLRLLCRPRLVPPAQSDDVDPLDRGRKCHGEVDVCAWNV